MIALPLLTFGLWAAVRLNSGSIFLWRIDAEGWRIAARSLRPTGLDAAVAFGWIAIQALFQSVLPGRRVQGRPLPDGSRLTYRMNGLAAFVLSVGGFVVLVLLDVIPATWLADRFLALAVVITIACYPGALFLYFYGKRTDRAPHFTGIPLCDFFLGAGHNPRIPPRTGFDLKLFFEARPGLIGWVVLDVSFLLAEIEKRGGPSVAMILVVLFQFWYVLDYFLHEEAILSTMDVVQEGFGWMLLFGDAVWVPFTYSIQAFYLLSRPVALPWWAAVVIVVVNFTGYAIFRTVNLQKHRFRREPDRPIWGRPPVVIETSRGTKLLASGFWGWSRHFNYVGDILMALAWGLPCLFGSFVPYFYVVYFTILLVHRQRRDDRLCAAKYGEAWEEYRRRVRWRIVPGIY
jgi:protein-S-isoprenylcysteine O-methyltransferase Ste14